MESINKTTKTEQTVARLSELMESLKGWNLISGLYSGARSPEEDLVHALAVEARELALLSLSLTFKLGDAGVAGRNQRFQNLLMKLENLDEREKKLATLCRAAMAEVKSKKGKEVA